MRKLPWQSAAHALPASEHCSATWNRVAEIGPLYGPRVCHPDLSSVSEAKHRLQGKSPSSPTDNLELPARSQHDLDDQQDYDNVAS